MSEKPEGSHSETEPDGTPRCSACGRPTDDIEGMDKGQLLEEIHLGTLRGLARTLRSGDATHQELSIARGLLRDNKVITPIPPDEDPNLPGPSGKMPLPAERKFPDYGHDE